jgi:hypothetical protein
MKEKVYAFIFAALIAFVGYVMVSTAAAHTARDNAAMLQWRYEHAVRP